MAIILNIETATEVCSVCISKQNDILAIETSEEQYSHASNITRFIENCCRNAKLTLDDIDAVAVSQGPGSYTGLRVGLSTAKGICYALDKPLIGVDTLKAIATAANKATKNEQYDLVCAMIDARRMEVYHAIFDFKSVRQNIKTTEAYILDEDAYKVYFQKEKSILFCGNGSTKASGIISDSRAHFSNVVCSAAHLVPCAYEAYISANFEDTAYFSPFYLKTPNITKAKKII